MYRILRDRSPSRELGAGLTWLKKAGQVVEFANMADAEAEAKKLNERIQASDIKYTAKRYNQEGDGDE
jgi:hypothetical protein